MEPNKTPPTRDEPLSAYVRRTRGDVEGCGPDWLADRIAELEEALAAARQVDAKRIGEAVRREFPLTGFPASLERAILAALTPEPEEKRDA